MPYLVVEDFRFGMDRRRERVAGVPGTLWLGKEVHVNRGGDIERRKKFVSVYSVPGTFGAFAIRSQLYVFGSADLAATMPAGVQYQRLQAPSAAAMTAILDVKSFSGKLYVIAEYADGNVFHFYDGTRVTDWDIIADDAADFSTVASAIGSKVETDDTIAALPYGNSITITARTAGTAFTLAQSTTDGGGNNDQTITLTELQANVVAVEEVLSSVVVTITGGSNDPDVNVISSITIDGEELLAEHVDWTGSNESTAIKLAAAVRAGPKASVYSAAAAGADVTITGFPGSGSTPNGLLVVVTPAGDVTLSADDSMTGGVDAVEAQAQVYKVEFGGTFEPEDTFTLTLNGTDYKVTGRASATGRSALVASQRVWSPVGSLYRYCMLLRADIWDPDNAEPDNDAGFLNVSSETEGNEDLIGGARYQTFTAMFSESSITLYQLDPNPLNFAFSNWLEKTGTKAHESIVRYGNDDVFYLDLTGIRSLRARDSSNAPFVSDIGNAIDTFVQAYVSTLSSNHIRDAIAAIEPRDGRLWMVLGTRIFVLSYFPSAKISAWTYYEPAEFEGGLIDAVARVGNNLHVRSGDNIFVYGGVTGLTEPEDDEVTAQVELPFLSGKTPATIKDITGFDIAATNVWSCNIAYDPNDTSKLLELGNFSKITFAFKDKVKIPGMTSMVAPILSCSKGGAATLSMLAIHYETEADPG